MHCSKLSLYSITSSARVSIIGGTVIPMALAVFSLMTSYNLSGWMTGNSAGFEPFSTLAIWSADSP
jgi:hypothetical protein